MLFVHVHVLYIYSVGGDSLTWLGCIVAHSWRGLVSKSAMAALVSFLSDTTIDSSTLVNQFSTLPLALRPWGREKEEEKGREREEKGREWRREGERRKEEWRERERGGGWHMHTCWGTKKRDRGRGGHTFCNATLSCSGESIASISLVIVGGPSGSAGGPLPNSNLKH